MFGKIISLFGGRCDVAPSGGKSLQHDREIQQLKLEISEQIEANRLLKEQVQRLQSSKSQLVQEEMAARMEQFAVNGAVPMTQLLTQAHLLEAEGKMVGAKDVLAVAKRLLHLLEDMGLSPEGKIGQEVPFDPNRHELLGPHEVLKKGTPVMVRFLAILFEGKVILKAGVERV